MGKFLVVNWVYVQINKSRFPVTEAPVVAKKKPGTLGWPIPLCPALTPISTQSLVIKVPGNSAEGRKDDRDMARTELKIKLDDSDGFERYLTGDPRKPQGPP